MFVIMQRNGVVLSILLIASIALPAFAGKARRGTTPCGGEAYQKLVPGLKVRLDLINNDQRLWDLTGTVILADPAAVWVRDAWFRWVGPRPGGWDFPISSYGARVHGGLEKIDKIHILDEQGGSQP